MEKKIININKIIDLIFSQKEIVENPPVLLDIGASEQVHPKWKKIAKYSICVAFDADRRDFQFIEKEHSTFRKLFIYNSVVSDIESESANFYLTKSPYCSSLLEPNLNYLKEYIFSDLFEVEKTINVKTVSLQGVLNYLNIKNIDWFKTDSQGIDLRLFKNLDESVRRKIIVAEFEPGFIDSYYEEDKLFSVLKYLDDINFWLAEFRVKGVPRMEQQKFNDFFATTFTRKLAKLSLKPAPGWAELTFVNSFDVEDHFSLREYLLGWLFTTIKNHHSFAYSLALNGFDKFNHEIFKKLEKYSSHKMKLEIVKLKFLPQLVTNFKNSYLK